PLPIPLPRPSHLHSLPFPYTTLFRSCCSRPANFPSSGLAVAHFGPRDDTSFLQHHRVGGEGSSTGDSFVLQPYLSVATVVLQTGRSPSGISRPRPSQHPKSS